MTNLTEKWKKGELPEGWYYVKDEDGQIIIAEYSAYCIDKEKNETECDWSCSNEPEQVLSPVPSYEEWKSAQEQLQKDGVWYTEISHKKVLRENKQLKERVYELAEANQSLRKQLDEEKAKNRIDYYNGSPMNFLDECERDRKKNKIYKNWINNIREELIISDLRRSEEGNKFVVNFLKKINQVLGEE